MPKKRKTVPALVGDLAIFPDSSAPGFVVGVVIGHSGSLDRPVVAWGDCVRKFGPKAKGFYIGPRTEYEPAAGVLIGQKFPDIPSASRAVRPYRKAVPHV